MATTSTAVVVTEGQSTLLRAFIDQVNSYKFNNPTKKITKLTLSFDATTGSYSIDLEEAPVSSGSTTTA